MLEITLHNGTKLRSEDINHAMFWEKGADSGIAPARGYQVKMPDDTLLIVMKNPTVKSDAITGIDARADFNALDAAHVLMIVQKNESQVLENDRARYQAFQKLITNEGQLIWARYNALLTANTIVGVILGALASKMYFGRYEKLALLLTALFGLLLTWLWKRITQRGWELQDHWVDAAIEIDCWPGKADPFRSYYEWCEKTDCKKGVDDWIAKCALWVIHLFSVGYLIVAVIVVVLLLQAWCISK